MSDNKNLYIALLLSLCVILGWNYFYHAPLPPPPPSPHSAPHSADNPADPSRPSHFSFPAPLSGESASPLDLMPWKKRREEELRTFKRILVKTPKIEGSIALEGAKLDDVSLTIYRETIEPDSPNIVLFSPATTLQAYYAETGFIGEASGDPLKFPDPETVWQTDSFLLTPEKPVTLTFDNGQGVIFKRIISVDSQYMFSVQHRVENKTARPITLQNFGLIVRRGKPVVSGYAILHEGFVGLIGDSRFQEQSYENVEKQTSLSPGLKGKGGWIGFTDKYWAAALIPEQNSEVEGHFIARPASTQVPVGATGPFLYQTSLIGTPQKIGPQESFQSILNLFVGAKEVETITHYEQGMQIKNFDLMIDWGWFWIITKPMFQLIDLIHKYVGNFGVAILLTTILVKLAFFPMASKSYVSLAKMKEIQPQMLALRERFAQDKKRQQQEIMNLYKQQNINPVAGCLPILIQIPVFFALYKVIFITIEMRHAPFFGWIRDLSAPDPTNIFNLFGLLPFTPPTFLHLGLWPVLMGVSIFVQMKMNPEPADPVQKTMFTWMPFLFTFMLASFPAGLVIYWTWNNVLSIAQQYVIMRKAGAKMELWDNLRGLFPKRTSTVMSRDPPDSLPNNKNSEK